MDLHVIYILVTRPTLLLNRNRYLQNIDFTSAAKLGKLDMLSTRSRMLKRGLLSSQLGTGSAFSGSSEEVEEDVFGRSGMVIVRETCRDCPG